MFSAQFITNFTIKTLFWEPKIFFKYDLRMQEMLFQRHKFKKFPWGGGACPQNP
jgi:hypothetical protein